MNPNQTLVVVHDMYGEQFSVRTDQLHGNKTFLRLHDAATGTPLSCEDLPDHAAVLHRANICEHSRDTFEVVEALGDRWHQCPACRARVDAQAARLVTSAHH